MKRRRRLGASLGLIAVCALVLIVIGVGAFFLIRITGGSREVANATDAGALNVSKMALVTPGVPTQGTDFVQCANPPGTNISLLTYNRCVAQALLVAMNADQLKTVQAQQDARDVFAQLQQLSLALRGQLQNQSSLVQYFNAVANANSTKMYGSTPVKDSGYATAFMKPGQSTNVYWLSQTFPGSTQPDNLYNAGQTLLPPGGGKYMAGYVPITVLGLQFYGTPVFPQQTPHLVSLADFDKALQGPTNSVPPNSFKLQSSAQDKLASADFGGAVACSIVGVPKDSAQANDYPGSIPGGYVEITNLAGLDLAKEVGAQQVDASQSIFNNEAFYGVFVSSSGNFSTDSRELPAWQAYNASVGTDPNGHDASLYPPSIGFPLGKTLRFGPGKSQFATLAQALTIKDNVDCTDYQYFGVDKTDQAVCRSEYPDMLSNFNDQVTMGPPFPPNTWAMNVEVAKGKVLLAGTNPLQWEVDISVEDPPTGLMKFNSDLPLVVPPNKLNFGTNGTLLELVNQAAACSDKIISEIEQRCYEISPTATKAEVQAVLNTKIPIGPGQPTVFYIHQLNNHLVCDQNKPLSYSGLKADGQQQLDLCMTKSTRVDGTIIDTDNPGFDSKKQLIYPGYGDEITKIAPFLSSSVSYDIEQAFWLPSSGKGNMLGSLEFSEYISDQPAGQPHKVTTLSFKHPN